MNVSFAPEGDMVMKGGEQTFAAVCTKVSYAQIVEFAKLGPQNA
jgi:hypothetical protein